MRLVAEHFNKVLLNENQNLWGMLSFHAGYINAGGFLACHRFVSHMTGFGAQTGMSIASNEFFFALEMMLAPVFFIMGSICAGFLVDRKIVRNKQPKILKGIFTICCLNFLVFSGGLIGLFGDFGEPLILQRDFLLLFLLTFMCGLQNGLFAGLTSGQIRTTHITGLCTDIGLNVAKELAMVKGSHRTKESLKNSLRIKSVLLFSFGSLVSAVVFNQVGYWGFGGSFLLSIIILFYVRWQINGLPLVTVDPGHENA